MLNLIFGFGFLAVSIGGVISGIVTKQPSLIIAGACFVVLGVLGLVKHFRFSARGGSDDGPSDDVFFLMDVSGSPGIFAACIVLFIVAAIGFVVLPPTHAYWS